MKYCRVCLSASDLMDIFQFGENIASNIMLFTSVQVIEGDGLPQQICSLCKIELDICLGFKNKCEATYETIRSSWSNKIKVDLVEAEIEHESDFETYSEHFPMAIQENTYITCQKCNVHFLSQTSFNSHLKIKHGHICNICDLHFKYRKELTDHLKDIHEIISKPEKNKQCHICGTCFKYHAELKRHTLTHSGIKEFKCKDCGKHFSSKGGLNKHTARHSNVRKLPCPSCPKMFIHQSNLHDHIKVHINQKKYSCQVCSKRFKSNRTLVYHLKIHSNERDFPCAECDKAFTNKYDLLRHATLHEQSKETKSRISGETVCV
ncbi:gastrula zinc finger protein XlCGF42.1-like isoform X3 [Anoplophora glabripennis]|uniref:gastrula zinc finger protein XlCGF42.1-like isoform X3 n=1 Tax=Anoplophora glabripennis TaxID=217634 RepID=UPI00087534C4|nr:gastrula zinc finger protein XlCGF42.1-like isoform X3 [Anoplophora glabripennis]